MGAAGGVVRNESGMTTSLLVYFTRRGRSSILDGFLGFMTKEDDEEEEVRPSLEARLESMVLMLTVETRT
jgi:hypothetical protein